MNPLAHCLISLATVYTAVDYTKLLPPNYQQLSGMEKQAIILALAKADTYKTNLPRIGNIHRQFHPRRMVGKAISMADFRPTFRHDEDVQPFGRTKLIHEEQGTLGSVSFRGNPDSTFTGLFRELEVPGVARFSLAGMASALGFTPGIAVKLFVDGKPSANLIAMYSVNGQGKDNNPGSHDFSNVVPPPRGIETRSSLVQNMRNIALQAFGARFGLTVGDPTKLSVAPLARVTAKGNTIASPSVPFQVFLEPTKDFQFPHDNQKSLQENLKTLKPGTTLYKIYASATPGGAKEWVGDLILTGDFFGSKFVDEGIFFRHESDSLHPHGF